LLHPYYVLARIEIFFYFVWFKGQFRIRNNYLEGKILILICNIVFGMVIFIAV
jgi:hypothetical protein